MKHTLGIIGNGFVGKATKLFKCAKINVLTYDVDPNKCEPLNLTLDELVKRSNFIFVCVPTPMKDTGECDTSIVEMCIDNIRSCAPDSHPPHIIVRSTVPVGFCNRYNNVNHMPEFLTEANWEHDFKNCELWIIGDSNPNTTFSSDIVKLFIDAHEQNRILHKNISIVDTDTSEFVKLGRNCFLAAKLSICNEFYSFCQTKNIDYTNAIQLIGNDKRIGTRYTQVPGPDGKTGWSGTCFPKDTMSFVYQLHESNVPSYMIEASVKRNTEIDRHDQDWKDEKNKGRTFV